MSRNQVMVIAQKENFLVRVLTKKIIESGIDCVFATYNINNISKELKDMDAVTVYMDEGMSPPEDVLHYLGDALAEENGKLMLIGEGDDLKKVTRWFPSDVLYKSFTRPVNNEEYIDTLKELLSKADAGEFKKQLLVVDDDPNYLSLVREWLKGSYKVAMANSGLQALKWLGKNKADLILLDHEMPVTSGPQVLEMLRNDDETKDIPVMFLTGKSDKKSVMEVIALKPEGYFLKTIEREELLEKLKEFFILHS